MKRRHHRSRLGLENLEPRNLLAIAQDDVFHTPMGTPLNVSEYETGFSGGEFIQTQSFPSQGGVVQMEYSSEYDLLFTRNSGSAIRVFDTQWRLSIDTHLANRSFTDIDLSPDGRYLFAADFSSTASFVHRYDLATRTWEVKSAPHVVYKIEAVDGQRLLTLEQDQHIDMFLDLFGEDGAPMTKVSQTSSGYRGDFEFDFRTNRIYHGNSGSSSEEIRVSELFGNALVSRGTTGTYGTAQGYGASTVLSSDGQRLYYGSLQVEASDVSNNLQVFPEAIHAATPWLAFGTNGIYDAITGQPRGTLGFDSNVFFVTDIGADLWAFDDDTDTLYHYETTAPRRGVLVNDQGVGELSATLASDVGNGELTLHSDGRFNYLPDAGFVGTDTFTYIAQDADGDMSTATVSIVVTGTNHVPVAVHDNYSTTAGTPLVIGEETAYDLPELVEMGAFAAQGNVSQIVYSPVHDLLFLRTGSNVRVLDARLRIEIGRLTGIEQLTDMDLTSDDGFLFVADYGGTSTGNGTPVRTHYVHRFDLTTRTWQTKAAPTIAYKIEAIDSQRFVILEADQHVDVLLSDFGATADASITQLKTLRAGYGGDIEFDPATGRIFHGGAGSSSTEINVRVVDGTQLVNAEGSGTYGTAQGYGGSLVLSADAESLYYGKLQVDALDVRDNTNTFPEIIRAASSKIAFGTRAYYDARTSEARGDLGFDATVFYISPDSEHVWAFDPQGDVLHHYRLEEVSRAGVLANDRDADGDVLTAQLVAEPEHGTVVLNADGTFTYTPADGFVGIDTFSYGVADGKQGSATAQAVITVASAPSANHPPVAVDDAYQTYKNTPLVIGVQPWRNVAAHLVDSISTIQAVKQIEYSPQFDMLFARTTSSIRIYDAATGVEVGTKFATNTFTDMDLTADGRYLFAADYGGTNIGYGTPSNPHYVHRYDLVTRSWDVQYMPGIAYQIEAVDRNRVLLKEIDQHVDITYNDFLDWPHAPMEELSRVRAEYIGDFEYDPRSQRLFHGSTGSSSHEVLSFRLNNGALQVTGDTGVYGTAQGYQGPSALSSDGRHFYYGRLQVDALDVRNNLHVFPETIFAANGQVAFGKTAYYDARTGTWLGSVGFQSEVWFVSDDGAHAWAADPAGKLRHFDLSTLTSGVLLNDTDPDGDQLQVALTAPPNFGTLSIDPSGAFRYVPQPGFVGRDEFAYMVADGRGGSSVGTIRIDVTNNVAPIDIELVGGSVWEHLLHARVAAISVIDLDHESVHTFALSDNRFEIADGQLQLKLDVAVDFSAEQSIDLTITATDQFGESVSKTFVINVLANPTPWSNTGDAFDVSGDAITNPLDALLIIIELNANGSRHLPQMPTDGPNHHFFDTSGDGLLSPLDAILVIIFLNAPATNGEAVVSSLDTLDIEPWEQSSATMEPGVTAHDAVWDDFSTLTSDQESLTPLAINYWGLVYLDAVARSRAGGDDAEPALGLGF